MSASVSAAELTPSRAGSGRYASRTSAGTARRAAAIRVARWSPAATVIPETRAEGAAILWRGARGPRPEQNESPLLSPSPRSNCRGKARQPMHENGAGAVPDGGFPDKDQTRAR